MAPAVARRRRSMVALGAPSILVWVGLVSCSLPLTWLPGDASVDRSRPVNFDAVTLAPDRRSGRIDFIGGREFAMDDTCSVAYVADVNVVEDELQIAVYPRHHPRSQPGTICTLEGHSRLLVFELEDPFEGNIVRDLAGQLFFLEAPDGLVEIEGLPAGWQLVDQGNVGDSPEGRWRRLYASVSDPAHPGARLEIFQAFGGPARVGGGETVSHVVVDHEQATLFLHPPSGEMVLVWELDGDGLALVGNVGDFSQDEFVQLAESITAPDE